MRAVGVALATLLLALLLRTTAHVGRDRKEAALRPRWSCTGRGGPWW
jgi:hypothetical protein